MAAEIPDHVRRFAARCVGSIAQLEVLLLVRSAPDTVFSDGVVASTLRMAPTWADEQLRELAAAGLVGAVEGGYRYDPSPPDASVIDELASLFATHRIAVITLIASQPSRRIQSFSDAFRLRKGHDRG